jgi:hypothetical protein
MEAIGYDAGLRVSRARSMFLAVDIAFGPSIDVGSTLKTIECVKRPAKTAISISGVDGTRQFPGARVNPWSGKLPWLA